MPKQAPPFSDALPGERVIAEYRGGSLTLTDHRVLYKTEGPSRDDFRSVRLAEVGMVGLSRSRGIHYTLFLVPIILVLIGLLFATIDRDPAALYVFSLLALVTLPLPWLGRRPLAIHVATPSHRFEVPVPNRHRAEGLDFVRAVEAARFADQEHEDPSSMRVPTTHAFQG